MPLPGLVSSGPRRDFLFPWLHHLRFGLVGPECRVLFDFRINCFRVEGGVEVRELRSES